MDRYQEALLLDSHFVYSDEEELLRFDSIQTAQFYTDCVEKLFLKYLRDNEGEEERGGEKGVEVTVGQVMYAVFKLHCCRCEAPLSSCKFPGCSLVRGQARADDDNDEDGASHPLGTGLHPIERGIRRFLFSHRAEEDFELFPEIPFARDFSAEEEILEEEKEDRLALERYRSDEAAKFKWSEISTEGKKSIFLSNLRNFLIYGLPPFLYFF